MVNLTPENIEKIVNAIPLHIKDKMMNYNGFIAVAGGFPRDILLSEPWHDCDVWCPDKDVVWDNESSLGLCREWNNEFPPRPLPKDLDRLLNEFDLTVCQIGVQYDFNRRIWIGRCSEQFLVDVKSRTIRVPDYLARGVGVRTLFRIAKLQSRGFHVAPQLLEL